MPGCRAMMKEHPRFSQLTGWECALRYRCCSFTRKDDRPSVSLLKVPRQPGMVTDTRSAGPRPRFWLSGMFVVMVLTALSGLSFGEIAAELADTPEWTARRALEALPTPWRVWLEEEVYPLISREQREAFLRLQTEAERNAFSERLWLLWGRETGLGAEFRRMYRDRLQICRTEFRSTTDDRSRVLLIHGPPDLRLVPRCSQVFNGIEVWGWSYLEGLGESVVVVFYRPHNLGPIRLWVAFDGLQALYTYDAYRQLVNARDAFEHPAMRCMDGDQLMRLIQVAQVWADDPKLMRVMSHREVLDRGPESVSKRFMEFTALLPEDAESLEFSVTGTPRGMRGGKVQVGLDVTLQSEGLGTTPVGDVDVVQLDVIGEVAAAGTMVDRFRYLFSLPSAEGALGLRMDRWLRPGDYSLRVKVEDSHSKKAGVTEIPFSVRPLTPAERDALDARTPTPKGRSRGAVQKKAADNGHEVISLLGPSGDAVSGLQRFEAITLGEVSRVAFLQDGEQILSKNSPPFAIDLDLGPLPRLTTITAIAFDRDGTELDSCDLNLNVGRERFFVRLQPIGEPDEISGKTFVSADLNIPSDGELERLELFWNETLLATLYQAPVEAWVKLALGVDFGYLRAVVHLKDERQAEDIRFINAPEFGSVVDVTSVELPVVVLDRDDKPVENLKAEDFSIIEDGAPQQVTNCALHRDLPVRLGIVIDTSGSMEETLPDVQRVVSGFLEDLLRPRDRAFIETFADRPEILAGFTADFETLGSALLSLYADRDTALYDAIVMGLFQFSGIRGRRAMIVLTDGEDTVSKFAFDEVVGYASRAGVTIYAIGVDLPFSKVRIRHHLKRLGEVTGGRAFFLARDAKLEAIYEAIDQELRTQYRLAYTSNSERPPDEFREVEVRVNRKRVEVRTVSGYYPDTYAR